MSPDEEMFFSKPIVEMPKISAPTASEICAKSKPSPEGLALLEPEMTPAEYLNTLEKNKLGMDSVSFLAYGLPPMDAICWSAQSCKLVMPKLSLPELDALKFLELWLKNPLPDFLLSMSLCLGKVDFTGPAGWSAQAALWLNLPGMPTLMVSAVIGAILLSAGLKIGVAMPAIPMPKLELPMLPLPPEFLLKLKMPQVAFEVPKIDQLKLWKLLFPFIDLGKCIGFGTITCR